MLLHFSVEVETGCNHKYIYLLIMKVNTRRLYDTWVYFTKFNKFYFHWTYYEKATKLKHWNVRTLKLFCNL